MPPNHQKSKKQLEKASQTYPLVTGCKSWFQQFCYPRPSTPPISSADSDIERYIERWACLQALLNISWWKKQTHDVCPSLRICWLSCDRLPVRFSRQLVVFKLRLAVASTVSTIHTSGIWEIELSLFTQLTKTGNGGGNGSRQRPRLGG